MFLLTTLLCFFRQPIYVSFDSPSMFLSTAYLCFFLLKQISTSKNKHSSFSIANRNFNTGPNSAGLRPYKFVRLSMLLSTANLCLIRLPIYVAFDCLFMVLSTTHLCFFQLSIYVSFVCLSMFLLTAYLCFFQLPIYVCFY
jgi:hypothetical protein